MDILEKLTKLKKEKASMEEAVHKAQGALEAVVTQLRDEFGVSLEEAPALLDKLKAKEERLQKTLTRRIKKFERRVKDD